jgi:hypothetical protein
MDHSQVISFSSEAIAHLHHHVRDPRLTPVSQYVRQHTDLVRRPRHPAAFPFRLFEPFLDPAERFGWTDGFHGRQWLPAGVTDGRRRKKTGG